MSKKQQVVGQTGSTVLSNDAVYRKLSRARTARYRIKRQPGGYVAEIIGPFHSTLYGAHGPTTSKHRAKAALQTRLANNHGYHGCLILSDIDSADVVGLSVTDIWQRANNEQREELRQVRMLPITR
jgi:hypothetical protein